MRLKHILITILVLLFMVTSSFANTGIILGDLRTNNCSETSKAVQKQDFGIIYTFTGIIYTFTGVIYTFNDSEKNREMLNCGIILSD